MKILHDEELTDLYRSLEYCWVGISRRLQWVKYVNQMREEICTEFWWEDLLEANHLGRLRKRWEDKIKERLWGWKVDGTDCWLCLMPCFRVNYVEPLDSAARHLVQNIFQMEDLQTQKLVLCPLFSMNNN